MPASPLLRVDGREKVTGAARYAAEWFPAGLAHGALIQSPVARGRLVELDVSAAAKVPGVIAVLTRENRGPLRAPPEDLLSQGRPGESRVPLEDDMIHWAGQHLGVVIAESLGAAQAALRLVRIRVEGSEPALTSLGDDVGRATVLTPEMWAGREKLQARHGDAAGVLGQPENLVISSATYVTPIEHHHPIEPAATMAEWPASDRLVLHDATRGIKLLQRVASHCFALSLGNVRVVCPFIGGAFGSKGFSWSHILLAAAAARLVGRPVRLALTRAQMSDSNGLRAHTVQTVTLGASRDGRLVALRHDTLTHASASTGYAEPCGIVAAKIYACPAIEISHRLARLNLPTPVPMRAPGEATGVFALECAMDELAEHLRMDPLALREKNHADGDPTEDGRQWSSKRLRECYRRGAELIGWAKRPRAAGATRGPDGRFIGWGMATAVYPAGQSPAAATARLFPDGSAVVRSATHEAGTGTLTTMTQLAAEALGVPPERIRFELGDSDFPEAPVNGGSRLTASVGPAVLAACAELRRQVIHLAVNSPASPLRGWNESSLELAEGKVCARGRGEAITVSLGDLLQRTGSATLEATGSAQRSGESARKWSFLSFGAHFCEVHVDPTLGTVSVARWVSVLDIGRLLNPTLARSQVMGAVLFGVGMALMEASVPDRLSGRFVNANLADYHVPTHADTPARWDIEFLDQPDPNMGPPFARGLGEIGIVGVPAALANAIWHATGRRVRELPITPDKLLL